MYICHSIASFDKIIIFVNGLGVKIMYTQDYSVLLQELKAGKESAFDSLFRLFYKDLCRFACSFLNDPMMAEDVVQEVFEKVWTRRKFIDEDRELDHYLYVSVRNACYTLLKQKKERLKLEEVDSRKTYTEEIPSESDGLQLIRHMIEELPFQCRVIFKLVVLEEMKYQEVATYLDISVNTVKTQMKIAYKLLREKLRPYRTLILVCYFCRHFLRR